MKEMDIPPMEPWLSRIAEAGWNVWFYIYKAIVPLNLTMIYPKWEINPADPLAWLPLTSILALFALLIYLSMRYRLAWSRAVLFALAAFVITLGPVLGLIDMAFRVHSPVADHFQYFALPALTALFSATVVTLARSRSVLKLPLYLFASALVLAFAFLSWTRVQFFQDIQTVSRQNIAVNPNAALAWHNLGYALEGAADLQAAADAYNRVLQIIPYSTQGTLGLVRVLVQSGHPDEALSRLNNTLALKPNAPLLLNSRGNLRFRLKDPDGAIADFKASIQAAPDKPAPHNNLGNILASKAQLADAILHYKRAIELDPEFASAHLNLANALFRTGDFQAADAEYQTALRLNPQSVAAHFNYAVFLLKQGMSQAACQQAQAALSLDPKYAPASQLLERIREMSSAGN